MASVKLRQGNASNVEENTTMNGESIQSQPTNVMLINLCIYQHFFDDTYDISKHLAARKTRFYYFMKLNYEETIRIGVIFEGFEIILISVFIMVINSVFSGTNILFKIDVLFFFFFFSHKHSYVDLEFSYWLH